MAIDLSKFIQRFIDEARDHLTQLSDGISLLEQGQGTAETIHGLFRSAHTVKGSSRMLKLMPITQVAHQLEEVLSGLRERQLVFSATVGSALQQAVDHLSGMVDQLANKCAPADISEPNKQIIQALTECLTSSESSSSPPEVEATTPAPSPVVSPAPIAVSPVAVVEHESPTLKVAETVRVRLEKLDQLLGLMGEVVSSHGQLRQRLKGYDQLTRQLTHLSHAEHQAMRHFYLAFKDDVQQQELQMNALLDSALMMRMLPLAMVFDPMRQMVRALGQGLGKSVTCVIHGSEIELDRQLIDKLGEPMVHLIRNAIDHGIESGADRVQAGKPAQGKITLSARQDAGWVVIDICDDGAGIAIKQVLEKAIRKGFVGADKATGLSDQEVIDFIFLPGFSTSAIITDISGRGVGMDVVKTTIVDELQGTIQVETRLGQGCCFSLRLPVSLAVMRVLSVRAGNHLWAFTAQHVAELLRFPQQQLLMIANRQVMILRNEFIPVVGLSELLGLSESAEPVDTSTDLLLLVIRVRHEKLALIIDVLEDERDMVIKPLPEHIMRMNQTVSGMVVASDQSLVNVLHAPHLLTLAKQQKAQQRTAIVSASASATETRLWHILVVDDSLNTREIEKDVLEVSGYQVTLAEDGLDGLMKAREGHYDAVLTDVEMPNMDGFTLTANLRKEEKYRHTPIMIITSREKEEDKRRGIQVGADAYIVKSDFEQSNLVSTLKALLSGG